MEPDLSYTLILTNADGLVTTLPDAVQVDGTVPTLEVVTINGAAGGTPTTTVTLAMSATDPDSGVAEMIFSNDGATWSGWQSYASQSAWTLVGGDGTKTVYGRVRDAAGNVSAALSDTITLDTSVPAENGVSVNNGALFTNQITVTLFIGANPGIAKMQISNEGNFAGAAWEPYSSRQTWQITNYPGSAIPRFVYARYQDVDGAVSSTYLDDIILDDTPPSGTVEATAGASASASPAAALSAPPGVTPQDEAGYQVYLPLLLSGYCTLPSGTANVTLHLEASDDVSGVAEMMISHLPGCECGQWEPFASTRTWHLPDGADTVYVKFRDSAGNESAIVTDTISR